MNSDINLIQFTYVKRGHLLRDMSRGLYQYNKKECEKRDMCKGENMGINKKNERKKGGIDDQKRKKKSNGEKSYKTKISYINKK